MRLPWIAIGTLLLVGCAGVNESRGSEHALVLRYEDFGPQAAAHELLGFEWYQWNAHGSDNPLQQDDIRVVVYRDVLLDEVKRQYPVIRGRQDYRYVSYEQALAYCDRLLREHGDLLAHLKRTKQLIYAELGETK